MRSPAEVAIRPIRAQDDAAMASVIRTVMPEFGATGCGSSFRTKDSGEAPDGGGCSCGN